jgi:hypothetical protein
VAYVVDRGPWGTLNRKNEWHQRTGRLLSGEHYRGDLDLLPGTYSAIGLVGIEKVWYWPIAQDHTELFPSEVPLRAEYPSLRLADRGTHKPYPDLRLAGLLATDLFPPLRLADPGPQLADASLSNAMLASK